jgi:hypothetical protein
VIWVWLRTWPPIISRCPFPGTSIWSWRWSSFELTPLSLAGWTVLTMALALPCGVLIRRVQPAMIARPGAAAGRFRPGGNHGQSVAFAADLFDVRPVICMPQQANPVGASKPLRAVVRKCAMV